jgi:hypothetical protein
MSIYRNLRRHDLLMQRRILSKRLDDLLALKAARQYFDQCNLAAFENALSEVEAQLSSEDLKYPPAMTYNKTIQIKSRIAGKIVG